jgi:hypothetical protein
MGHRSEHHRCLEKNASFEFFPKKIGLEGLLT